MESNQKRVRRESPREMREWEEHQNRGSGDREENKREEMSKIINTVNKIIKHL